jgi:hypothetical protein
VVGYRGVGSDGRRQFALIRHYAEGEGPQRGRLHQRYTRQESIQKPACIKGFRVALIVAKVGGEGSNPFARFRIAKLDWVCRPGALRARSGHVGVAREAG